ncbi:MAG: peptidylprolyl isomerase [Mariniblastus sp.]|nr:peptidylprolyl isomerase [Mariniblastus sp.]
MNHLRSVCSISKAALTVLFCALPVSSATAQINLEESSRIAATVNSRTISVGQIERAFSKAVGKAKLNKVQTQLAKKATLEQIINQHVVLSFLESHQSRAGANQIIEKLDQLKAELATVDKTLEQYLKQTGKTKSELEFEFAWQIAWQNYLDQKLTDGRLEAHFLQHRRRFDGTELRLAHLLLKPERTNKSDAPSQLVAAAKQISNSIKSGELSWEQAVEQHSQAPTRDSAGVIGWIKLSGPMPKSFTNVAFGLNLNQISDPVVTTFGVHLIKCIEVKPGKIGWRDNIKEIRTDAIQAYFDAIVAKHRKQTKIEYGKPSDN